MNKILKLILCVLLVALPSCTSKQKTLVDNRYDAIIRLVHEVQDNFTYCTATVISDQIAITAFHCLSSSTVSFADKDKKYISSAMVYSVSGKLDQAVLMGDFSKFKKMKIKKEQNGLEGSMGILKTCGYAYGGKLQCFKFKSLGNYIFMEKGLGRMYPAMSGGPLIDLSTGEIVATNVGAADGYLIVTPMINFYHIHRLEK